MWKFKYYNEDEGKAICTNCGKASNLQIEIDIKPTYPKTYQRYEHFCKLLDNVQSRGKIDNGVIEIIKKEIKIERVNAKELKWEDIKKKKKKKTS